MIGVNRGDVVNPENPAIKEVRGSCGREREVFELDQSVPFVQNI